MKKGFTLAEVLITLAVIGVVATLTLPNVIGNHQNKVLMTQLQKTINTVQNAALKAMEDNAAEDFYVLTEARSARERFLKNYFDTVNICDDDTGRSGFDNCAAKTYTSFDKSKSMSFFDILYNWGGTGGVKCASLTSGATVCISGWGMWLDPPEGIQGRKFIIDVNGVKGPNVTGKDLFSFYIFRNGKISYNLHNPNSAGSNYMQEEARGDYCTTSEVEPRYDGNICLPYIISHGWQFKY